MLRKSCIIGMPSQKRKKLQFNEANIHDTLHPIHKDYGFVTSSEAKTPYPSYADPIAAENLRNRLQEHLDRVNLMMSNENGDDGGDINIGDNEVECAYGNEKLQTPMPSLDTGDEERRRIEFVKKRKQFYKAEFIIAQQKSMSSEMPEPGLSVGNNWRTLDNEASICAYHPPSSWTTIIDNSCPSPKHSNANYDTLRAIVKQEGRKQ